MTEKEKQLIQRINDDTFTVEQLKSQLNMMYGDQTDDTTKTMAAMEAIGFYKAITLMAAMEEIEPVKRPKEEYIAVIRSSAIRDTQVCKGNTDDWGEDNWYDMDRAEIYLGSFEGENALQDAARYACTLPENIRLIKV